jgi:hypothetical protein
MKAGELVIVFGRHKGVVIAPGKILPTNPADWVRVEYRHADSGMKVNAFVERKNVEPRT